MLEVFIYTIIAVFLISLVSLIGIFFLSFNKKLLNKVLSLLISFAVGALFGDAFIHLLPESFERLGSSSTVYVLAGILLFFILEKFLRWHHCHDVDCKKHKPTLPVMNLVGDGVHNFVDGLLIAGSFTVSVPLGITTSLAILLHEIPQEIGDFAILVHGGFSVKKALIFNLFSALMAIIGAIFFFSFGSFIKEAAYFLLPITAGGFIYIAGSDLIPELHQETKLNKAIVQFLFIILGITVMFLL